MTASSKITKEMIVKSGVEVIRDGNELSARNLAKKLGISTQPIYSLFKNMEELTSEVKKEIQNLQAKMTFEKSEDKLFVYQTLGLGFVRFARDETALFSYLYLNGISAEDTFSVDYIEKSTEEMTKVFKTEKEMAYKFHLDMLIFCYGLAVMQSLGQNASDKVILGRLKFQFDALCKMYGIKQK